MRLNDWQAPVSLNGQATYLPAVWSIIAGCIHPVRTLPSCAEVRGSSFRVAMGPRGWSPESGKPNIILTRFVGPHGDRSSERLGLSNNNELVRWVRQRGCPWLYGVGAEVHTTNTPLLDHVLEDGDVTVGCLERGSLPGLVVLLRVEDRNHWLG